jgi:hypothetical protein
VTSGQSTLRATTTPSKTSAHHRSVSSRTGSVSTRHVYSSLSEVSITIDAPAKQAPESRTAETALRAAFTDNVSELRSPLPSNSDRL